MEGNKGRGRTCPSAKRRSFEEESRPNRTSDRQTSRTSGLLGGKFGLIIAVDNRCNSRNALECFWSFWELGRMFPHLWIQDFP